MNPMRLRLSPIVLTLSLGPVSLAGQGNVPPDSSRVLLLEQGFTAPADSAVAVLKKGVMYWAEVEGPGAPVIRSASRYGQPALVVDADATGTGARRFEVHVGQSGSYVVLMPELRGSQAATLRLYRDEARQSDSPNRATAPSPSACCSVAAGTPGIASSPRRAVRAAGDNSKEASSPRAVAGSPPCLASPGNRCTTPISPSRGSSSSRG